MAGTKNRLPRTVKAEPKITAKFRPKEIDKLVLHSRRISVMSMKKFKALGLARNANFGLESLFQDKSADSALSMRKSPGTNDGGNAR